tara:strand:- start:175 stop:513 length:339 start_codon:yes stop_codon:yes gene_type:complete
VKNILSILLVSILLFGCSKEEEIQPTVLNTDLYGNWESSVSGYFCYTMTISSNGQFVYQSEACNNGEDFTSNSGQWWVEETHLVLSGYSWGLTDDFSVSGNSLEFDGKSWVK